MGTNTWTISAARAHFAEVVRDAQTMPQVISVRGHEKVVVISKREFDHHRSRKPSFLEFIRSSPFVGVELELERDKTLTRS
jgi:prevent-host-death family protein